MHSTHKPEIGDKVLVPGCRYCMVCMTLLDSDTNGPTDKAAQPCPGPTSLRPAEEQLAIVDQAHEQYRRGMHDSRLARWMMTQLQADERNGAQSPEARHALSRVVGLYALAYGDPDRLTHQLNAALFEVQRRWMLALAEQYRHRIGYEAPGGMVVTALVPVGQAGPLTWLPRDLAQAWFGDKLSVSTREAYLRDGWHWIAWCQARMVNPLEATPGAVRAWIDDQRTGAWHPPGVARRDDQAADVEATIARRVSSVSRLYVVLRGEGVTAVDPLANVTRPRPDKPSDARILGLGVRDALVVLRAAEKHSTRMAALLWLLAQCGLRISEALAADVTDVTTIRGHRSIAVMGKGRKRRSVTVPPDAGHRIDLYLDGRTTGPLFLAEGGARWDRSDAGRAVRRLGRRLGLQLHPHKFRHTAATLACEAGEPLDRVADMLGHASINTTRQYIAARNRVESSASYGVARLLTTEATLADQEADRDA